MNNLLCNLFVNTGQTAMTEPRLSTAANGHWWITFEADDTPQWFMSIEWLGREGFIQSGTPVLGFDEGILPSYVKHGVTIAAGFDNWSGNYLLAECEQGDQVILRVAHHVGRGYCSLLR